MKSLLNCIFCLFLAACGANVPTLNNSLSEALPPFGKLPKSFCAKDSNKIFILTIDSFSNSTFKGNWYRIAGKTEQGADTREDEALSPIIYDAENSSLSFIPPFSEDSIRVTFNCIFKNNSPTILVSNNFEFADTLIECSSLIK